MRTFTIICVVFLACIAVVSADSNDGWSSSRFIEDVSFRLNQGQRAMDIEFLEEKYQKIVKLFIQDFDGQVDVRVSVAQPNGTVLYTYEVMQGDLITESNVKLRLTEQYFQFEDAVQDIFQNWGSADKVSQFIGQNKKHILPLVKRVAFEGFSSSAQRSRKVEVKGVEEIEQPQPEPTVKEVVKTKKFKKPVILQEEALKLIKKSVPKTQDVMVEFDGLGALKEIVTKHDVPVNKDLVNSAISSDELPEGVFMEITDSNSSKTVEPTQEVDFDGEGSFKLVSETYAEEEVKAKVETKTEAKNETQSIDQSIAENEKKFLDIQASMVYRTCILSPNFSHYLLTEINCKRVGIEIVRRQVNVFTGEFNLTIIATMAQLRQLDIKY